MDLLYVPPPLGRFGLGSEHQKPCEEPHLEIPKRGGSHRENRNKKKGGREETKEPVTAAPRVLNTSEEA